MDIGFLSKLIPALVLGLWVRNGPRRLGTMFALWWAGLLLMRPAPQLLALLLPGRAPMADHRGVALLLSMVGGIGSVAVLRALIGLALWNRPRSRKLTIYTWLMAAAVIGSTLTSTNPAVWAFPCMPFLWSFRWRQGLGARRLIFATLTGFFSMFLSILSLGRNPSEWIDLYPGPSRLVMLASILIFLYSIVSMPIAASRIHLSIRRIGYRLIGSHLLAGLIPFTLAALFLLASSGLFLATYRGTVGLRAMLEESDEAGRVIARALAETGRAPSDPFGIESQGQIVIVRQGEAPALVTEGRLRFPADSLMARPEPPSKVPLLWDGTELYLRSRAALTRGAETITVEALSPVDTLRMNRITRILGVPVLVSPQMAVHRGRQGIQIGAAEDSPEDGRTEPSSGSDTSDARTARSIGPSISKGGVLPSGTIADCFRWSGGRLTLSAVPVSSSAGIGEQIISLFQVASENVIATLVLVGLGVLAALFLGALWVATSMVIDMGRSVTNAIRSLTDATAALREGRFEHRIQVEGQDELWSVAGSFNEMAEGLQKMREVERESHRLEEELRLARVIQDRLLPAAPPELETAELAGVSLPAREIGGDYYDYLVLDGGLLGIAVADVSGKGAPAALLMSTFRASLRSQDLARLGPAEVLARINRFIHSSVDPGRFITAFLGLLDPSTGEFRYANAGHDAPLLVRRDGVAGELAGGGLILGLLPQIAYEEALATLDPGTLVAIFTDGVTEARDPAGGFYGPERLAEVMLARRSESCVDVLRHVVDSIQDFSGTEGQSDDITLVLIRRR
jgi:serine phosphatase RsbU (regulator of sigma subunit)